MGEKKLIKSAKSVCDTQTAGESATLAIYSRNVVKMDGYSITLWGKKD